MRINIGFDKKSIDDAIKRINELEKKFRTTIPEAFLNKCLDWFEKQANMHLAGISIGSNVIINIQQGWTREVKGYKATLINTNDKAVYVEFGVGLIGGKQGYPQDYNPDSYEYDIDSKYKDSERYWRFNLDDENSLDIKAGFAEIKTSDRGNQYAKTQGSPANLFMYQSIVEFQTGQVYKTLWKQTLAENL